MTHSIDLAPRGLGLRVNAVTLHYEPTIDASHVVLKLNAIRSHFTYFLTIIWGVDNWPLAKDWKHLSKAGPQKTGV